MNTARKRFSFIALYSMSLVDAIPTSGLTAHICYQVRRRGSERWRSSQCFQWWHRRIAYGTEVQQPPSSYGADRLYRLLPLPLPLRPSIHESAGSRSSSWIPRGCKPVRPTRFCTVETTQVRPRLKGRACFSSRLAALFSNEKRNANPSRLTTDHTLLQCTKKRKSPVQVPSLLSSSNQNMNVKCDMTH